MSTSMEPVRLKVLLESGRQQTPVEERTLLGKVGEQMEEGEE